MNNQRILFSVLSLIILAIIGFSIYQYLNRASDNTSGGNQVRIADFQDCAKAGYPVMESYPRQCRVPSGELFVEIITNPSPIPELVLTGKTVAGYAQGHVTIGPFCPVERIDQPCQVPPEAYTLREAVVYGGDSTTIKARIHLDGQGNYKIALAPGTYFVQIAPAGIGPGEKKQIIIKSNKTTIVDFDIDTGIR